MTVYIPTLGRLDMLKKTVPFWLQQEMDVRLVVERHEYVAHQALKKEQRWGSAVYVLPLKLASKGIGYSRQQAILHARATNRKSIIMSDDDVYIPPAYDAWDLLYEAEDPRVLGIGATRSLHDRFTDGAISRNHGVILCPGGWGFTIKALNVDNVIKCGNFDPKLHSLGEDAELARQAISRIGIPWLVHCDVRFVSLNKRYAPGGFSTRYKLPEARLAAERDCMRIIHDRWPLFTNSPDKKLRMAWQRFLDVYIPDWKYASAIHGGDLKYMRNKYYTPQGE
jgi:hypothetical protein